MLLIKNLQVWKLIIIAICSGIKTLCCEDDKIFCSTLYLGKTS